MQLLVGHRRACIIICEGFKLYYYAVKHGSGGFCFFLVQSRSADRIIMISAMVSV